MLSIAEIQLANFEEMLNSGSLTEEAHAKLSALVDQLKLERTKSRLELLARKERAETRAIALLDSLESLLAEIEACDGSDHFWGSRNARDLSRAMNAAQALIDEIKGAQ